MSRIPKNNINTPFLHIMVQGNNKNFIFNKTKDVEKYLKILKDTKEEIEIIILAYCIMGNHAHLLFYVKDMNNLIRFMQKTNLLYAKYYNNKYDRVGYVFRDRYKTQPIMSEKHLITCINYIHNNPVKAEMCKNASDYIYSSYNQNIFESNNEFELKIRKYVDSKKNEYTNDNKNDFILLEDEEINKENLGEEIIHKYLKYYNISLQELKEKEELLVKIVKKLKASYNISYRITSKILGIKREKLRVLISKYDKKVK